MVGATAAVNETGADGAAGSRGAARAAVLVGPQPAALRAATRNRYSVPFDSPDTVYRGFVDTPSFKEVQSTPFVEHWIR